mgnify:FL=1
MVLGFVGGMELDKAIRTDFMGFHETKRQESNYSQDLGRLNDLYFRLKVLEGTKFPWPSKSLLPMTT